MLLWVYVCDPKVGIMCCCTNIQNSFKDNHLWQKKIMIKGNVRYLLPLYFELLIFSCWNHDISPQQNELHRSLIRICASLVYDSIRFYVPMPKTQTVIIRQHSPILLLSHLVRLCFAASVSTTKRALVTFIFSSWNDALHILFNFTRVEVMLRLRGKSQTLEIIVIVIFLRFLCLFFAMFISYWSFVL